MYPPMKKSQLVLLRRKSELHKAVSVCTEGVSQQHSRVAWRAWKKNVHVRGISLIAMAKDTFTM